MHRVAGRLAVVDRVLPGVEPPVLDTTVMENETRVGERWRMWEKAGRGKWRYTHCFSRV